MLAAAIRPATVGAAPPSLASPCDDAGGSAPYCDSALGALHDVSSSWRQYQAALVQPVPIKDYAGEPEDAPPPAGAGVCGTETVHQPASGPAVPASTAQSAPIAGVPPPPGGWRTDTQYCVLRYLAADFTPLCTGCARMFVDFDAIPATTVTQNPISPGADGHYALRLTMPDGSSAALVDGHSPNAKNLCSDKFFNPSPGADCANVFVNGFDTMGLGIEGETGRYVHYPLEGRYFNGPYYLAGDGASVPLHWVHGFYMDVNLATSRSAWYAGGYRGRGDVSPDTDQSYACSCEALHFTYSASIAVSGLQSASSGGSTAGGGTSGNGGQTAHVATALPNTAARGVGGGAVPGIAALSLSGAAAVGRRRRARRAAGAGR